MNPPCGNKEIISITAEEVKAITDPLYKAGINTLLRHGFIKLEESESQ